MFARHPHEEGRERVRQTNPGSLQEADDAQNMTKL